MSNPGPIFSAAPHINHVAMSLPAAALAAEGRRAIADFYGDVFGFAEHETMTEDGKVVVLGFHSHEQFLFLIAEEEPMKAPRLDHFGISVASKADFDEVHRRAAVWAEREPDEVDLIAPGAEDHGVVRIHNFYVRYRLPLMVETQFFEWLT
jgi:catechol-2,3-dioxygenase